ncbi:MAG: hypothetical protein JKY48_20765 [Flavobacteriales bacterium]|nr:hypothetical protein [Flavobacteriales bacterium]
MRFILLITVICLFHLPFQLISQSTPVAASLENNVDLFTGDFNYSIPLIQVSGPNGESFPLQLNYNSNIKTNQEASWVGLGWSLGLGEINRQVNGLPDDWNAVEYEELFFNGNVKTKYKAYGPVWFKEYDYNNSVYNIGHQSPQPTRLMDIASSGRKTDESYPSFKFPDYDSYYVSGPGVGGKMRPYLFDYAEFHEAPVNNVKHKDYASSDLTQFTQDVQFRFVNDPSPAKNYWPYYETNANYAKLSSGPRPIGDIAWPSNLSTWRNAIPEPGTTIVANFTPSTEALEYTNANQTNKWDKRQKVYAANFIEYFTNDEIQDHYDGSTSIPDGFIDFQNFSLAGGTRLKDGAGTLLSNPLYDPSGIGAFRVTTPNGMTYHYSLPVYVTKETHTSCSFNNVTATPSLDASEFKQYEKKTRYAYTWKLTAITGLDYVDVNANNFADEGDSGYWIYINYEKWNKDDKSFIQRAPYHGFFIDKTYKGVPTTFFEDINYQLRGSKSERKKDIYYPNYVKTATQTLFIVKELGKDGHGAPEGSVQSELPQLKVKELILIKNEDLATSGIFSTYIPLPSGPFSNLSNDANINDMLHSGDYAASKATVDPLVLGRVSLNYDYSLCPEVYNNIDNTVTLSSPDYKISGVSVFDKVSGVTAGTDDGKLTLTKLYVYGQGGNNIYGVNALNEDKVAYEFEYPSGTLNPAYRHDYKDFFGNYKVPKDLNHFDRIGYTTESDVGLLPSWSLNKITTPLKGEIDVSYEADEYSEIYYQNFRMDLPTQPRRFFDFTCEGSNCSTLVFTDPDAIEYIMSINNYSIQAGPQIEIKIGYDCNGSQKIESSYINIGSLGSNLLNNRYGLYQLINSNYSCSGTLIDLDNVEGRLIVNLKEANGGGIRVKSISLTEPDKSEVYTLKLTYGVGVIGTENGRWKNEASLKMKPSLQQADRFAPPNVVGYKSVKSKIESVGYLNSTDFGEVEYQFYYEPDVFVKSDGKGRRFTTSLVNGSTLDHYKNVQRVSIFNNGLYGTLKKKIVKNRLGNPIQTYEYKYAPQITNYITNGLSNSKEGSRIREVFYKSRIDYTDQTHLKKYDEAFLYEEIGYKLKDIIVTGVENTTTYFTDFDPWNGSPTRIKTVPFTTDIYKDFAYEHYANMGSKFLSPSNSNQLNASYSSSNTRHKEQNNYTTWANTYYTRELSSAGAYVFVTKTAKPWKARSSFLSASEDQTTWTRTGKVSLYNEALKALESIDRKGNFSATKYNLTNEKAIASASNCNYRSFFASSFEERIVKNGNGFFDNEIIGLGQQTLKVDLTNPINPHTGKYMVKVLPGTLGPNYLMSTENIPYDGETLKRGLLDDRTYEASVWVHHSSPNDAKLFVYVSGKDANGATYSHADFVARNDPDALQIGDWILMKIQFNIPDGFTADPNASEVVSVYLMNQGTGDAYYDDFRLQPIDAQVQSIVFDEQLVRPLYVLNNENFFTQFVYDAAGNVIETYIETEQGKLLQTEKEIHYAD